MTSSSRKWSEWTPSRALRRTKSRALLQFFYNREDTAANAMRELKIPSTTCYKTLRGLQKLGFIEILIEPGTWPAFTVSEKGKKIMQEKGITK